MSQDIKDKLREELATLMEYAYNCCIECSGQYCNSDKIEKLAIAKYATVNEILKSLNIAPIAVSEYFLED
jgi:hypothetical protein